MVDPPAELAPKLLKNIQDDIADIRKEAFDMRASDDARFDRLETLVGKQRRDTPGILATTKGAAGLFDVRVGALKRHAGFSEQPRV